MVELEMRDDETLRQYIARVGEAKDAGLIDLTWEQLAPIMNQQTGENFTESVYRKKWREGKSWWDEVFVNQESDEYLQKIQAVQDELYKSKVQYQDQRREYNALIREDARFEHIVDRLTPAIEKINAEKPLFNNGEYAIQDFSNKEAILVFADFHLGMRTENVWSNYNLDICKQRIKETVNKTIKEAKFHGITKLHVVALGDLIHGAIHTSARVASNETTVDQLVLASELLAESLGELSKLDIPIDFYSTYGNHARTIQNKKDSIHSDNLEKIVPWWIKERLPNINAINVNVIDSEYYEFIYLNVCGNNIVCTHGDLDKNFKNIGLTINTLFTKKYNKVIDCTITADQHHLEEFEQFGIESILTRSLCGTDDYANGKRLYSIPGQTLLIFDENGRDASYSIKFTE